MYRIIVTVLFLFASLNIAQSVKVINTEKLISGDMERLYFPRFSPDGQLLAMTKSNFRGLWLYDLRNKELTNVNNYFGSGYNPDFSDDGRIHFTIDDFKNKRKSTIAKVYNPLEQSESDDTLKSSLTTQVKSSNNSIAILTNGKAEIIKPLGAGNYIWVSLSPDKNKILFTYAGRGTFICELDGRIITELGYANAPQWSPNGDWITYMNDVDDGLNYISSDIFIVSSDGKTKFNITNTDSAIEMYPQWSPDGKSIVYQNIKGEIFLSHLGFFSK